MDLVRLDDNYLPEALVEKYSSLVWNERYEKNGEFVLTSNNIQAMVNALPLESVVSLMDSTVPMVVESWTIEKKLDSAPQITVNGRTFETVLERRASVMQSPLTVPPTSLAAWTITAKKPSDAAYKAMRVVLGDIGRSAISLTALSPAVAPEDAFLRADHSRIIDLTPPVDYDTTTPNTYTIPAGDLYSTIIGLISTNHHGIKSTRPLPGSNFISIEIYNGANLTGEGTTGDPNNVVSFDARFDQFDDSTYLLTEQASTNVAYVYGPGTNASDVVYKNKDSGGTPINPSGLDRRVLFLNLTEDNTVPSGSTTQAITARQNRGLIELYNHNKTALFDGAISTQIASDYNKKYFLGDIIRLNGEYGLHQNVRIAEFIRSSDSTGEKAYPTFETVDTVDP